MLPSDLAVRKVSDDPNLEDLIEDLADLAWPPYMRNGHTRPGVRYHGDYMGLYKRFPQFICAILDPSSRVVAAVQCCPLLWEGEDSALPDEGWDWQVQSAAEDLAAGNVPNTLGAVVIMIHPEMRGRGLSAQLLEVMKGLEREVGLRKLIAPVRPTQKSDYPFLSMQEFAALTTPEGLSIDAWVRTHQRIGGKVLHPCNQSMQLQGSVVEWQKWTGIVPEESGLYAVKGGLAPVEFDLEKDLGVYVEPNLWVVHEISA